MLDKLEAIKNNFLTLEEQMSDPDIINDQKRYREIGKEYTKLKTLVDVFEAYKLVSQNLDEARIMSRDKDEEMREIAKMEVEELEPKKETIEAKIRQLLMPKDPEDERDVLFEVRAGTGGDEASIFAGDLFRMYVKYFESQGWSTHLMYENEGSAGGYKEVSLEVKGEDVYGRLKFESGTHRVQRIPSTESKGRVHTSAATVAVMPKMEMDDVDINRSDLRIDTFRASGAGGQHVNKTESGVRLTHIPTGVVVECTEGRSQHSNKEIAEQRLYQKIYEMQKEKLRSEVAAQRKSLVGSGDRSEKIRTYNYPQNRVTDHRIDLTLYNLDQIIEGDLDKIIEALQIAENADRMQEIEG